MPFSEKKIIKMYKKKKKKKSHHSLQETTMEKLKLSKLTKILEITKNAVASRVVRLTGSTETVSECPVITNQMLKWF